MTRRDLIKQGVATVLSINSGIPFLNFKPIYAMKETEQFDVIIIGGSYAGLSAAMALGRSLRKVLIIDGGKPCNRQTPYSHNFLTQDGKTPQQISSLAKDQVLQYSSVSFLNDLVIQGAKISNGFEVKTQKSAVFTTKKLIFATGVKDLMPAIKGFSTCWGISVIHCPYCHGYEHKGVKTALMANGERAYHMAPLIRNLTKDLTLLTQGKQDFDETQLKKLNAKGIKIIEKKIREIVHEEGAIKCVVFQDGSQENFEAAYAAIPFEQHTNIPRDLGCELTEQGHLKVDFLQQTAVKGLYACGDNSSPMRSVAYAVATGNIAGAMANKELTEDQF